MHTHTFFFPDKAAFFFQSRNVVVYLAVELKRFVRFPSESHLHSQWELHGPPIAPVGEGVDNTIQMCWAPSMLWQMFLNSFRGQDIFIFYEITNYLTDALGSEGKRWSIIMLIKGIWKLTVWKVLLYTSPILEQFNFIFQAWLLII